MIDFLINNFDGIAFVSVIAIIILSIKDGYEKQMKDMLLYLVLLAEETYGDNTGKVKLSAVSTWLYEKMPSLAKMLFTSSQIEFLIDEAVQYMKKYLEDNPKAKENILG